MNLRNDTLKKLRLEYFYYLVPIFIINFSIPVFYIGLDFYIRNSFDFAEFLKQILLQTPAHYFYLLSIALVYFFAEKKFKKENDLAKFCKRISDNTLLSVFISQTFLTIFISAFAFTEISKDKNYDGKIVIYFIVIVSIIYQYIVITTFLTYIATQIIERKFKTRIFELEKILFDHGNEKIKTEILVSFFVIGLLPLLILFLFLINEVNGKLLVGDRIYLLGTFIVVSFGTLACFTFVKELISVPIENLIIAMSEVENGNLKIRVPISKSNELSLLSSQFNRMLDGLEEKEQIKTEFGKYLSPEVAKEILNSKKNIWDGEEKEISILFTDIEGFTSISEKLETKEIVKLLNEYFTELVKIISKNNGVVNKFIGDSILAIYNAPLNDIYHADNALKTAIEISKLNSERVFADLIKIKTRVGINTGKAIIGNLGSTERLEYTVIGDSVNVAQRLEAMNKELGTNILISEKTKDSLTFKFDFTLEKEILVKGRKEAIKVFGI